jgi:hypothetical protein
MPGFKDAIRLTNLYGFVTYNFEAIILILQFKSTSIAKQ